MKEIRLLDKKFGLVLEGGGYRGCYSAGALKWLYDNDIHFSYVIAISAGCSTALYYSALKPEEAYNISINGIAEKGIFGVRPFLQGKGLFDFEKLRINYLLPHYQEALDYLRKSDRDVEIGLLNMSKQETQYFSKKDFDEEGMCFKAACVLPLTNDMVELKGDKFLDGGTEMMVPIERSLQTGHEKNLIIVTKEKTYVRKPNGLLITFFLNLVYGKYKKVLDILKRRVEIYNRQMGIVQDEVDKKKAVLIRPSKDTGVGRFSGTNEQMIDMYNLGYQDMENQKEEIFKLLELK